MHTSEMHCFDSVFFSKSHIYKFSRYMPYIMFSPDPSPYIPCLIVSVYIPRSNILRLWTYSLNCWENSPTIDIKPYEILMPASIRYWIFIYIHAYIFPYIYDYTHLLWIHTTIQNICVPRFAFLFELLYFFRHCREKVHRLVLGISLRLLLLNKQGFV